MVIKQSCKQTVNHFINSMEVYDTLAVMQNAAAGAQQQQPAFSKA
jgi:hypothetical protein